LEPGDNVTAGPRKRTPHNGWVKRSGKVPPGYFTADTARDRARELVQEHAAELAAAEARRRAPATFTDAATAWLDHLRTVKGAKASHLRDCESMLRPPDAEPKLRGRTPRARIMSVFGDRELASITDADVAAFLRSLDRDSGLSPRSINKHRQVLHSIFAHAMRKDTFGLAANPVVGTDKRRQADPTELHVYAPEQVEAIARAMREGRHRPRRRIGLSADELEARRWEDQRDATVVITAAMTGLRQGELRALRWRNLHWTEQTIHVQRALSADELSSTKGRRSRVVPLIDRVAVELERLSRRPWFTGRDDLVFAGRLGKPLDDASLSRRYIAARDAVAQDDPDLPRLRFHDLRHTFGTLAASRLSLVEVQAMLGHRDLRTTERYLHARPAAEHARTLGEVFGSPAADLERDAVAQRD
jgi:integrase